tara:strand:+ start:103 stop:288 length:186 start_codon:yes stop_codon:yes gene_type:complete
MIEIPLKTQLFIGVITFLVFYLLIKQIIKNISSTNEDGDLIIDLNKTSGTKKGKRVSKNNA